MKQSVFTILLLSMVISLPLKGQKSVNKFIDRIKEERKSIAMTIPGWLIRKGIDLSTRGITDSDEKEIRRLGKKIKKFRFAVLDDNHSIGKEEAETLIQTMKEKDGFSDYLRVRDKGNKVYVMVQEKKEKIKYLTIFVYGESTVALLNLKTDLTYEDLAEAEFSFKDKEKFVE